MLKLRNIYKYYKVGKNKKIILNNINLDFKKKELVFILGSSGSGKSTLLNIIAGNLLCDSGEIYLDDFQVSKFNDRELNNYRSSIIGFIFQDYNLIDYMSVIDNINLTCNKKNKNSINVLLKQLGIYEKKYEIVNKLSGGEKQRVAIARAMINNPSIILADEPTGALDSANSIEVMEILKKISQNKLVIVVSHDNYLASKYADRIINIQDGKCEYFPQIDNEPMENLKKNKIKKSQILKLALKNLWLKKGRTLFTSLAISLGFISIAIVLCLSTNFNNEIESLEKNIVSLFPISISNGDYEKVDNEVVKNTNKITIKEKDEYIHTNKISSRYIDYLKEIPEIKYIKYSYDISLPIITDSYKMIDNKYFEVIPTTDFITDNYDIISGRNIIDENEILLKIDSLNNVSSEILNNFNIDKDIDYEEIIGRKIKIILNDLYYLDSQNYYIINSDNQYLYDSSEIELVIVGIVREKEIINDNSLLLGTNQLIDKILSNNKNSKIVLSILNNDKSIFNLNGDNDQILSYLGYNTLPNKIEIYVDNIKNKELVVSKLDEYNQKYESINEEFVYIDTMNDAIKIIKDFILIISIILLFFSMIAIIISSLMISILTNIRVLERKKEIGIFRSLGASKKDILRLFNTENIIIGLISSIIGVIIIITLKNPINNLLENLLDIENLFNINKLLILGIILFNILIVKISGSIPAKKASKLEIVDCIYNR